jgi:alginate O-acetyltransferase complex protein AlgI
VNFASIQFLAFLAVVWPLYWGLNRHKKLQDLLLLLASYFFYASWDPRFLVLIILITSVSHAAASWLQGERGAGHESKRKPVLVAYLVFCAVVLGFFKYFNFFADSGAQGLRAMGFDVSSPHLEIILPAAISFYVFESISFVVGAYQRTNQRVASWVDYALFIAFFPKLVAGPIERPNVLVPQLQDVRRLRWTDISEGSYLVVLGLFKKIAIADGLAPTVSAAYDAPGPHGATDVALATLAFTLQIYGDFSGYSDIARGISRWFGIRLSLNFNVPYSSMNPSEFWRRWHMSLSSWLRDYVYIPLGGNRSGEWTARRNLMATMLFGGLWHGAAWTYILWGAYQGLLLVLHRIAQPALRAAQGPAEAGARASLYKFAAWLGFLILTAYGWLIFRAVSLEQVGSMSTTLVWGPWNAPTLQMPPLSALAGVPLLMVIDLLARRHGDEHFHRSAHPGLRGLLYAALLFVLAMGFANARSTFIYFQF